MKSKKSAGKDKFLPYVTIVGVVAIVAIVTVFLWGGRIEGAPISSHMNEEVKDCSDTDPENNFYKAGMVKKAYTLYEDYCLNGKTLFQHSCEYGQVRLSVPYDCPNGCYRGACIE